MQTNTTMKQSLPVLTGAILSTLATFAAERTLPTPPTSDSIDTESSVNVPLADWPNLGQRVSLVLAANVTPSNNVQIAFGQDENGDEYDFIAAKKGDFKCRMRSYKNIFIFLCTLLEKNGLVFMKAGHVVRPEHQGEMKMKQVGSLWLVVGIWLLAAAAIVGVYRLGYLNGEIAAMEVAR